MSFAALALIGLIFTLGVIVGGRVVEHTLARRARRQAENQRWLNEERRRLEAAGGRGASSRNDYETW